MKKLLLFLAPVILLASCQPYGNTISGKPYPAQQCPFRPLDAATLDSAAKGWVSIDSSHAGNPSICQTKVKIEASWSQKWAIAKHDGSTTPAFLLWGLGAVCLVLSFLGTIWSKGALWIVGLAALAIVLGWFGASYVDWAFTKEIEIPKALFDTPGALKAYWDANLFL